MTVWTHRGHITAPVFFVDELKERGRHPGLYAADVGGSILQINKL
jgi:hypothetical protein